MQALPRLLANDPTLTFLNLKGSKIGNNGCKKLAEALLTNTTLTSLNLNGNKITEIGAASLAMALRDNKTLTSLNMNGNKIGNNGAAALAEALCTNTTLTTVLLRSNFIGENESKAKIEEFLERNRRGVNTKVNVETYLEKQRKVEKIEKAEEKRRKTMEKKQEEEAKKMEKKQEEEAKKLATDFVLMEECMASWNIEEMGRIEVLKECVQKKLMTKSKMEQKEATNLHEEGKAPAPAPFGSWKEASAFLHLQVQEVRGKIQNNDQKGAESKKKIAQLEQEIEKCRKQLETLENECNQYQEDLTTVNTFKKSLPSFQRVLEYLQGPVTVMENVEGKAHKNFVTCLSTTPFEALTVKDMKLVLCEMKLQGYYPLFIEQEWGGETSSYLTEELLVGVGLTRRDACCFLYHKEMMIYNVYGSKLEESKEECSICQHCTADLTSQLFYEYNKIALDKSILEEKKWTAPYLAMSSPTPALMKELCIPKEYFLPFLKTMNLWKKCHQDHFKEVTMHQ